MSMVEKYLRQEMLTMERMDELVKRISQYVDKVARYEAVKVASVLEQLSIESSSEEFQEFLDCSEVDMIAKTTAMSIRKQNRIEQDENPINDEFLKLIFPDINDIL